MPELGLAPMRPFRAGLGLLARGGMYGETFIGSASFILSTHLVPSHGIHSSLCAEQL